MGRVDFLDGWVPLNHTILVEMAKVGLRQGVTCGSPLASSADVQFFQRFAELRSWLAPPQGYSEWW